MNQTGGRWRNALSRKLKGMSKDSKPGSPTADAKDQAHYQADSDRSTPSPDITPHSSNEWFRRLRGTSNEKSGKAVDHMSHYDMADQPGPPSLSQIRTPSEARGSYDDLVQYGSKTVDVESRSSSPPSDSAGGDTSSRYSGICHTETDVYDESVYRTSSDDGSDTDQVESEAVDQATWEQYKEKIAMAVETLRNAQELRGTIPGQYLDSLDISQISLEVLQRNELDIVDRFEYQTDFGSLTELNEYLFQLATMFRIPEGRQKLKRLVKAIYGQQFSPFPPRYYNETTRNSMIETLPFNKKVQYFPPIHEPNLSSIVES